MSERNTVLRSLHDVGLAARFRGALMGAVGLKGAVKGQGSTWEAGARAGGAAARRSLQPPRGPLRELRRPLRGQLGQGRPARAAALRRTRHPAVQAAQLRQRGRGDPVRPHRRDRPLLGLLTWAPVSRATWSYGRELAHCRAETAAASLAVALVGRRPGDSQATRHSPPRRGRAAAPLRQPHRQRTTRRTDGRAAERVGRAGPAAGLRRPRRGRPGEPARPGPADQHSPPAAAPPAPDGLPAGTTTPRPGSAGTARHAQSPVRRAGRGPGGRQGRQPGRVPRIRLRPAGTGRSPPHSRTEGLRRISGRTWLSTGRRHGQRAGDRSPNSLGM